MKRAVKYALPLVALTTVGFYDDVASGGIFLKIGDIEGESTDPAHQDEIDVLAWSWGVSNGIDQSTGGPGAPIPAFSDIKIIKGYDKSSPSILLACATGEALSDATISVTRDVGGGGILRTT